MTKYADSSFFQSSLIITSIVIILFVQSSCTAANKSVDFLIIENPSAYQILNQYEQSLSNVERNQLHPFVPFEIISLRELLGDQITNSAKFKYNENVYFIPLDDNFQRIKNTPTWEKVYKQCKVYNDTVVATRALKIFIKNPGKGTSYIIKENAIIKRVFLYQSNWYITPLTSDEKYGWYSGSAKVFLKKAKQQVPNKEMNTTDIAERIEKRLNSANELYTSLFTYFNNKTLQQKAIPQWTMVVEKETIRCILKGASLTTTSLEESTRYITGDIEHILLGKPFSAHYSNGEIIISPRSKD